MKREKICLTSEDLEDFDFTGGEHWELRGETYDFIEYTRTDHLSDGESWLTIVKRESDGKFFNWSCWDKGCEYEMSYGENYIEEVFPKVIQKTIYE